MGKDESVFFRLMGWPLFAIELWMIAFGIRFLLENPDKWLSYIGSLAIILAVFQGLAWLIPRVLFEIDAEVSAEGDGWRIGRYSEGDIRALVNEALDVLSEKQKRVRVRIAAEKSSNAWTIFSILVPAPWHIKNVFLSHGALHYLEPVELKAFVLHEVAHHIRQNRLAAPGNWLAADLAGHGFLFGNSLMSAGLLDFLAVYTAIHLVCSTLLWILTTKARFNIEHRCDLFAASKLGSPPMINSLLKIGEEQELSDIVQVRAAKNLLHVGWVDSEQLAEAFDTVRPFGRIFHENLFKHASEIWREIMEEGPLCDTSTGNTHPNSELQKALDEWKKRRKPRIRWRRFDGDGDGILSQEEISRLCDALKAHPDHALVSSREEYKSESHPSIRNRVLVLNHYFPEGKVGKY